MSSFNTQYSRIGVIGVEQGEGREPSQLAPFASVPLVGYTILIRDIILGITGVDEIAL
ncbi:MAG: hypothetical protein JRN20_00910 [Nitrososphaerota archaeon]|nr:hypothetical protein [Nitrososphaerota archaeon]MDG6923847.1 hypothetical protein [Nitrososphaerota archaeon]